MGRTLRGKGGRRMEVKITERGWAGHFIAVNGCAFRRNTLIECGEIRWVVSTVGNYRCQNKVETIGSGRHYETMVFEAQWEAPYWEADVSKYVHFDSEWALEGVERESDIRANEIHETVVKELKGKIKQVEKESL